MKTILFFIVLGMSWGVFTLCEASTESSLVYSIQTSSFSNKKNAFAEYDSLLSDVIDPKEGISVRVEYIAPYYPVRIGFFEEKSDVSALLERVHKAIPGAIILKCYRDSDKIVIQTKMSQPSPEYAEEQKITADSRKPPVPLPSRTKLAAVQNVTADSSTLEESVPTGSAVSEAEEASQATLPKSPVIVPNSSGSLSVRQIHGEVFILLFLSFMGMIISVILLRRKPPRAAEAQVEDAVEIDFGELVPLKSAISKYFQNNPPADFNEVKCKLEKLGKRKFSSFQIKKFIRTL